MAPKSQDTNGDGLKQKSLMGWFGKPNASSQTSSQQKSQKIISSQTQSANRKAIGGSNGTAEKGGNVAKMESTMRPPKLASSTPGTSSTGALSSSFKSSSDPPNSGDTLPTSDAIDVDMQSEDEVKVSNAKTAKRKMSIIDSDDEKISNTTRSAQASSEKDPSSPVLGARSKKPRVSLFESDEEVEDTRGTLGKRLARFRKPGAAKKKTTNGYNSDSDFAPAEESDAEAPLTSNRGSSVSGSRSELESSAVELDSADELSDAPKPKKKSGKSHRPALKKMQSSDAVRSGGSSTFLTAAEQRAKDKKEEKKTTDDPFDFLRDVHDKDGNRPGEPGYDPRTLYIPKSAWKTFTPFERQFWEIKANHYDTVLFFQKGKFLELYEDDARIGHREFDLKLTDRVKMCMVGVPEGHFNTWAAKFLAKGYKVGRVDQAETALGAEMRLAADKKLDKPKKEAGDKIVRRELNKVYTNGTLVDAELIVDDQAGHCVSIRELDPDSDRGSFGVCVLDSSTSEFNLSAFGDDACRTKLETMLRQLRPKELLFTKGNLSVSTTRLLKAVLPGSCIWTGLREVEGFGFKETMDELKNLYPDGEDDMEEGANIPDAIKEMLTSETAVIALGAMIWYLRQLNIDKDILSMKNFNIYDPMKRGQGLVLDGQTLAHVEVLQNSEGTDEGSLLRILQRCITPFGKRLFRIWLCVPLREVSAINARLDAVQDLIDHPTFEHDFTQLAKGIPDLERIVSRIHAKNCKVNDFLKVLSSFKRLSNGLESLSETADTFNSREISGLLRSAPNLIPNIKHVESMFLQPEGGPDLLPKNGKDETYDGIEGEIQEIEESLDAELKKLEKKLGCKLSYWHSATGTKDIYLVETKASVSNVPKNWIRQSKTKAVCRWQVPDLAQAIRQLKEERERRTAAIKDFKFRVFAEFDKDRDVWLRAIRTLAELDCLFSLAKSSLAIGEPACRPEFVEGDGAGALLDFEELRHPTMCLKADNFIPNDVKLGGGVGRVALLTGPNMGGKSTAMRMTAAGVIMAQLGMLVPARRARISPVDAILTRMGAYDNMFSNASTFKVELDECCKILREATPRSLVILDELGRGTSTYDGMAIAGAVLHQLATHTLPLCFFATHYGSLTDDFAYHPNIRNMHMSTIIDDEKCELVFLYKLVEGVAASSFGTHVANLAGVPMDVVKRAEVISTDFARQFKERIEGKRTSVLPLTAQADFAYLYRLAGGSKGLPENKVKRMEVLRCLKGAVPRYLHASA
ncbi:DNA mismatch repair protein Msh6 [Fomitiporia mediterranea MF3/22]|uniref:DNA mismatch repair protein n=1 Tax=Fomitiporia mediterranea (strain MF3/22) TaxID=694068 RepID=R7SGD1_FOMME|nr:DNA mismatch repair protein Msh6 [Fomitiporia mediterranea MF3/22]EJC97743.1 DNA mismatch repair protein Msh6 [Fomitiporia mediterranea MF3/22]